LWPSCVFARWISRQAGEWQRDDEMLGRLHARSKRRYLAAAALCRYISALARIAGLAPYQSSLVIRLRIACLDGKGLIVQFAGLPVQPQVASKVLGQAQVKIVRMNRDVHCGQIPGIDKTHTFCQAARSDVGGVIDPIDRAVLLQAFIEKGDRRVPGKPFAPVVVMCPDVDVECLRAVGNRITGLATSPCGLEML